ncbi:MULTISPECIES: bifunctional hydroxymethylpyrimidine kinase/phosphomethylpyrimidine kinase [Methylosinus]|uniref:hydroxymethylpyrimidine kinase n=1 Tax=Methylosinus trichosporium (strain ATCC 35070 / NCIMB 11131 / UNIQEM 75 / OB3b) TaxID=595536 RepID=A0A2D2D1H5_METT3|nr:MULTISPECIES: bifunctional hydroxymethylpyrimidine kinase/phosphomethylpyrimidine kinase [Methylosinus]ATQ68719.1 hydroxymethylpyrimidine/phosphomethylpyrimidine kinase [Methylosinus trichosporium OB3b]OBS53123.1 bifunctional hydroxymethylpyrimidine kinase/phosphomethylpyrimidine kinase [Methylosinus sp. 3S-1]
MAPPIPKVLSIAGSDPSGGAGVQADIKTISALRCYAMAAVTSLTAQNTRGVGLVHALAPAVVTAQIDAIFADIAVDAVKIGMVAEPDIAAAVADALTRGGASVIVLDPVLVSTHGDALGGPGLVAAARSQLLPLARLVTPNLGEAAALLGGEAARDPRQMAEQARALVGLGAQAALVKGGHLEGEPVDILFDGAHIHEFHGRRVATRNTHGTGCALSAAIAARLAYGDALAEAVAAAKAWLEDALAAADDLALGGGAGPPHHFFAVWR